jgi:hypothetical protein
MSRDEASSGGEVFEAGDDSEQVMKEIGTTG